MDELTVTSWATIAGGRSKFAVVGLGYWGPNLLRNLIATVGATNVIAVDRSVDRLARVCADNPAIRGARSLEEALEQDDVLGVVVATPVTTHHAIATVALESGCHVLVEKPLAASTAEAAALVDLAAARDLCLMVGHTFLFSPRVDRICDYMAEGRLGQVQYVTSSRLNLGLHQSDISVIWDLAPHDFSIILRVLGEYPRSVATSGRAVVRPGMADVAFISLEFPSGVVASVSVSWLAPSKSRNTVIVGDKQMLVYDDSDNEQPIKLYDKGYVLPEPEPGNFGEHQLTYRVGDMLAPHVPAREPLAREVQHFVECCNGAATCTSSGEFGLGVVAALEAAERSWQLGGIPVAVDAEQAHLRVPAAIPA